MNREIQPNVWYEGRELAKVLGVSQKTLQRAGLSGARLSARRTLYLGLDVLAWLQKLKTRRTA